MLGSPPSCKWFTNFGSNRLLLVFCCPRLIPIIMLITIWTLEFWMGKEKRISNLVRFPILPGYQFGSRQIISSQNTEKLVVGVQTNAHLTMIVNILTQIEPYLVGS